MSFAADWRFSLMTFETGTMVCEKGAFNFNYSVVSSLLMPLKFRPMQHNFKSPTGKDPLNREGLF